MVKLGPTRRGWTCTGDLSASSAFGRRDLYAITPKLLGGKLACGGSHMHIILGTAPAQEDLAVSVLMTAARQQSPRRRMTSEHTQGDTYLYCCNNNAHGAGSPVSEQATCCWPVRPDDIASSSGIAALARATMAEYQTDTEPCHTCSIHSCGQLVQSCVPALAPRDCR